MKKKIILFVSVLFLCFVFSGCDKTLNQNEIIILYENDVHSQVDGYPKISGLKNELSLNENVNVGIVSVGDFIQGDSLCTISKGEYIINIMNLVGYDAVALGNHEFDYKIPRLFELTKMMKTKPICANLKKVKNNKNLFDSYKIVKYGNKKIGYIGITTPSTIAISSPKQFFDENNNLLYSFSDEDFFEVVQKNIDSVKRKGVDYVVALSHLGSENVLEKWSSWKLIKNTSGIDVVLDGHSHSVIENEIVKDKNGDDVVLTSTGTKFENIGKLTLSSDGKIKTELIPTKDITLIDEKVSDYISQIREENFILGEVVIGTSEVKLITHDENGKRLIRNTETNIGDFCADAFRLVTGSDIGFINGGGIRSELPQGEITINSILKVFPFNNTVCVSEVSGQDILDFLELSVMHFPNEYGSFYHVSGIRFCIDSSIPSSVKLDEHENFVSIDGSRRVFDVEVLNDEGIYEKLDPEKNYTISSHNYLILDNGSGATMFNDGKILVNDGMLDIEMVEIYITEFLHGKIGTEYSKSQNRIIAK